MHDAATTMFCGGSFVFQGNVQFFRGLVFCMKATKVNFYLTFAIHCSKKKKTVSNLE